MSVRAAATERVSIDGAAGPIEAVVEDPAPGSAPASYAVICHPHPLFGGTMDNKVVTTLARALHECAVPTLRFNFRGVGSSAGTHDEGRGETLDAAAVADWGAARWSGAGLVLAGFSFGTYVACRLAGQRPVRRMIVVAPPVGRFEFPRAGEPECPWLIVQGEEDDVVEAPAVKSWALSGNRGVILKLMPGVGHFFHGHLHELRDAVIDTIRSG